MGLWSSIKKDFNKLSRGLGKGVTGVYKEAKADISSIYKQVSHDAGSVLKGAEKYGEHVWDTAGKTVNHLGDNVEGALKGLAMPLVILGVGALAFMFFTRRVG